MMKRIIIQISDNCSFSFINFMHRFQNIILLALFSEKQKMQSIFVSWEFIVLQFFFLISNATFSIHCVIIHQMFYCGCEWWIGKYLKGNDSGYFGSKIKAFFSRGQIIQKFCQHSEPLNQEWNSGFTEYEVLSGEMKHFVIYLMWPVTGLEWTVLWQKVVWTTENTVLLTLGSQNEFKGLLWFSRYSHYFPKHHQLFDLCNGAALFSVTVLSYV